jgi:hypothetical protein
MPRSDRGTNRWPMWHLEAEATESRRSVPQLLLGNDRAAQHTFVDRPYPVIFLALGLRYARIRCKFDHDPTCVAWEGGKIE